MKKTFLLGVGAQKAGTTWLYQYLRGHPDCAMGMIKEHAVLQVALAQGGPSGRFGDKANALIAALQGAKNTPPDTPLDADAQARLLALMDNVGGEFDLSYYMRTFERLLEANPEAHLTGDITPEYCMLSTDQLRQVRAMIEGAGYDLKVVFLMRDPLDRVYSALRMADRNRRASGKPVNLPAAERFDSQGVADWVEQRTRYDLILDRLDAAFAPEQVSVGFYETFFSNETLTDLLGFLGLRHHPADFGNLANASPAGGDIAPEKVAAVRAHYDVTYRACADRFGAAFISDIWKYA
ncbi:sulfotransferase [uncultured Tateyamaria sp.]|uniref:sulfotransferase n=1 Tax=uncultured Tateyamaria sp. TaxID=455651 RepID=UPI00260B9DFB|nr:sulfotransferase [uncultured Tateyamaria sp.]